MIPTRHVAGMVQLVGSMATTRGAKRTERGEGMNTHGGRVSFFCFVE